MTTALCLCLRPASSGGPLGQRGGIAATRGQRAGVLRTGASFGRFEEDPGACRTLLGLGAHASDEMSWRSGPNLTEAQLFLTVPADTRTRNCWCMTPREGPSSSAAWGSLRGLDVSSLAPGHYVLLLRSMGDWPGVLRPALDGTHHATSGPARSGLVSCQNRTVRPRPPLSRRPSVPPRPRLHRDVAEQMGPGRLGHQHHSPGGCQVLLPDVDARFHGETMPRRWLGLQTHVIARPVRMKWLVPCMKYFL